MDTESSPPPLRVDSLCRTGGRKAVTLKAEEGSSLMAAGLEAAVGGSSAFPCPSESDHILRTLGTGLIKHPPSPDWALGALTLGLGAWTFSRAAGIIRLTFFLSTF